jgi:glucose/mannose-6-phosphate isomerase
MITKSNIQKIDSKKMFEVYNMWPEIAKKAYYSNLDLMNLGEVKHIVFAGMGGSGAIGDIFSSILSKTSIHVNVIKGYVLPSTVNSNTIVITTSVSGNTKETIAILKAAKELNCKILAFSDGGLMKKYCVKNSIEHRQIKMEHSPRASFTKFLYSMLHVLRNSLSIKNENTKQHAMIENVIEACHNGIVAWEKKSNVQPILIEGIDDHIKTKERYKILKELLKQNDIKYKEIISENGSILTKIISLIYFLDFSTMYKSVLDKVDPSPVKSIDFVKSKLI